MEILYNFKAYPAPKKALFKVDTNKYILPEGWIQKEELYTIIGETDDSYVYKLYKSEHGERNEKDKVVIKKYIMPLGVHKSRLVRWTEGQLLLF